MNFNIDKVPFETPQRLLAQLEILVSSYLERRSLHFHKKFECEYSQAQFEAFNGAIRLIINYRITHRSNFHRRALYRERRFV